MGIASQVAKETLQEYAERKNRECVPDEFRELFTPVDIGGGMFGLGGLDRVAVCNRCGAMIYPTALDRHSKFHEEGRPQ